MYQHKQVGHFLKKYKHCLLTQENMALETDQEMVGQILRREGLLAVGMITN
jgi:hypothetical protein